MESTEESIKETLLSFEQEKEDRRIKKERMIKNSFNPKKIAEKERQYAEECSEKRLTPSEIRALDVKESRDAFEFQRKRADEMSPRGVQRAQNEESTK